MKRLGLLLIAAMLPSLAHAAQAPVYTIPGGPPQPATGVFCLNLDGTPCTFGGGSGGGSGGDASAANQQRQIDALGAPADPATAQGTSSTIVGALRAIRDRLFGTLNTARPDKLGTGTLALATQDASIVIPVNADGTLALNWDGLTGSGAVITYEQANGNTGAYTVVNEFNTGTNTASTTRSTNGNVRVPAQGHTSIRLRVSTPGTGAATVTWNLSQVPFATWVPNLPNDLAREGTDGAGTNPGTGIRGWLSGIFASNTAIRDRLLGTLVAQPPASAAYSTVRTTGIGTTAVQVSAAATTARRVVRNISTNIACELAQSGGAYGAGHPLPAGESFVFDEGGRTTAAIFVACASAGGAASVLSY